MVDLRKVVLARVEDHVPLRQVGYSDIKTAGEWATLVQRSCIEEYVATTRGYIWPLREARQD